LAKAFPEGVGGDDSSDVLYTQTGVGQCLSEAVGRTPPPPYKQELAKSFPEGVGTTPQEYKQIGVEFWEGHGHEEWGQLLISAYKQELANGQGLPAESVCESPEYTVYLEILPNKFY
jgi:hypothetical protein